jgi:hypothetical protein
MVPGSIIAAREGFNEAAFFKVDEVAKAAPKVKF